MKKNWKFATMALVAGMSLFAVSCSDDTPANEMAVIMGVTKKPMCLIRISQKI